MARSELAARLAERFPQLAAKDVEIAVVEILKAIRTTLGRGDRVEIRGFGSFGRHCRPARRAHNPKTGEPVMVPAK